MKTILNKRLDNETSYQTSFFIVHFSSAAIVIVVRSIRKLNFLLLCYYFDLPHNFIHISNGRSFQFFHISYHLWSNDGLRGHSEFSLNFLPKNIFFFVIIFVITTYIVVTNKIIIFVNYFNVFII